MTSQTIACDTVDVTNYIAYDPVEIHERRRSRVPLYKDWGSKSQLFSKHRHPKRVAMTVAAGDISGALAAAAATAIVTCSTS